MAFKDMTGGQRKPVSFGGSWSVNQNPTAPDPYAIANQAASDLQRPASWSKSGRNSPAHNNYGKGYKNAPATQPQSPYGYASGPGILESWFNQRANGTDPGYEYAMNRGMNDIDNRMAAGGSYNSGARGQQLGDFAANMAAQRESQLDALAGGASGEYQGRLNSMFGQGQALASGQAGLSTAYDLGAAGNMAAANAAQQQMNLNSAAQQQQAHQGFANNLMMMYGLSKSGGGGGGGGSYYNANNPYPV